MNDVRLRRGLWAVALSLALGSAARAANPAYTDATKTDDDFAFQGEYVGEVPIDGSPMRIGVHVVALGDGKFDVVAYPGGLPGDGWQPPTRVLGTGTRSGAKVRRPAQVAITRSTGKWAICCTRSTAVATSSSSAQASQGGESVSSASDSISAPASGLK